MCWRPIGGDRLGDCLVAQREMHDAENERGGVTQKWLGFRGGEADLLGSHVAV
jgi:hypothetical protein